MFMKMSKNIQWKKSSIDYNKLNELSHHQLVRIENGKNAVVSGQLGKAAVNGGKTQGKLRGKINVESGHLNNIRKLSITKEARDKAKANTNYKQIAEKMKKPIYQFDMNGKFINKFNSVKEASEFVGCSPCSITNVAKGKSKSCKKSIWKYQK